MTLATEQKVQPPRFSLILCTADTRSREAEIKRLLDSLTRQSFGDFEVVVVDQNHDYDLGPVLAPFEGRLALRHIHSARGLSRSRNRGLEVARGSLCGFPDDDCWYGPDLLKRVAAVLGNCNLDGVHGKGGEPNGADMARFDDEAGLLKKCNVFERSVSCGLFYRTDRVREVGGFDERLGLGSGTVWTGCEDYDLPLRMVERGMQILYDPSLKVFHPCPCTAYDMTTIRRAATQSPSFGHLLVRHRFPAWYVVAKVARPLAGAALAIISGQPGKSRFHLAAFRGRASGVVRSLQSRG